MAEKDINNQPQSEKEPFIKVGGTKGGGFHFNFYWIYMTIAAFLLAAYCTSGDENYSSVDYSDFQKLTQEGCFKEITVEKRNGTAHAKIINEQDSLHAQREALILSIFKSNTQAVSNGLIVDTSIPSTDKFYEDVKEYVAAEGSHCKDLSIKYDSGSSFWENILSFGSPLILLLFFWFFVFRRMGGGAGGGGIFSVGKSKATIYEKENRMKVTFQDVAGLSEAKQEVREIVDFLKNPQKYTNLGGKIPKGALLVGPPGTGKTLLAKAVAGEANVPFFSMSGSDFVEMFVGVGASRVRDLFHQAKQKSPCIIFIDEIDAIGRARGNKIMSGGNDERENTLNQLLTEMDGFGTNSGVIILAATNRADILDKALLRAGRFDRQIHVDLPELNDRIEIFKVHLKPIKLSEELDIRKLARQTPGFSGADIANVCNEAALIAARSGKSTVEEIDFNNAVDRIIGGLEKKSKVMTQEEKHSIAVHEAGHATVSWNLQYGNPLVKVTIVPRGNALGAAWYMPEERQIVTYQAMCDELCGLLAGRAAEELFIGSVSSGAANDLERVTKQAYAMVAYYGMSQQLPNVCYYDSTGQEYSFSKPYSDERAKIIDQEVSRIIAEQYNRAKAILTEFQSGHNLLAQTLEEKEVIFTEDVEKIFGQRRWASRNDVLSIEDSEQASETDTQGKDK